MAIKCDFFEENYIYKCKECKKKFYFNETNCQSDYSTTGDCYGLTIRCPDCEESRPYDWEDPEWSSMTRSDAFNCVVIGKQLPKLSKWCTRRKQKPEPDNSKALAIELKNIKYVTKEYFMEQMEIYDDKLRKIRMDDGLRQKKENELFK